MSSSPRRLLRSEWQHVCARFASAEWPQPSKAGFVLDDLMHDSRRHYAGCREDGKEVRVASDLAALPQAIRFGILAHEAGHVVDFCQRRRIMSVRDTRVYLSDVPRRASRYQDEVMADMIAGAAMGIGVGYVKYNGVWLECLGSGVTRPKGIR